MRRYLIFGPNGTGKSAIGEELKARGYTVVDADTTENLSYWINNETREKVPHNPPFTKDWLEEHQWVWDAETLLKIIKDPAYETMFLVGGAHNMQLFMYLFDKKFFVYADFDTVIKRLQKREPQRWLPGTAEVSRLKEVLDNIDTAQDNLQPDIFPIKNTGTVKEAADKIISLL